MKKGTVAFLVFCVLTVSSAQASLKQERKDDDQDGYAETEYFYSSGKIVKAEVDNNKDRRADWFVEFREGTRSKAEADRNFDGKIDCWMVYNLRGRLLWRAKDSNGDGKPDQYTLLPGGSRDFALKEYDKNFDDKIDQRVFSQWDADKKITVPQGNRMMRIPNPGYRTLWRETDKDFDGVIDEYTNRADKKAPSKVGQAMDARVTPPPDFQTMKAQEKPQEPHRRKSMEDLDAEKLKRLNDKYGLE